MSDINDIVDYENRQKQKQSRKPISKSRIEWAIESTQSIRAAAIYLGVAYNTFKKYAIMYDLFEQNKNQPGIGVTNKGNTGWGIKIQDIFDGKHPKYPHWKLQERLVRDGYLKQECSNCGYDEYREKDFRGPFLINFFDGNPANHNIDNLHLLCYNCFFIIKPVGKMLSTPNNITTMRKRLEKVWIKNEDE